MGKNKYVDLFTDMIPAVDQNIKELWDAAGPDGQAEIKGDLWNLNRYISCATKTTREIQEHFVLTVNEFYNKNWSAVYKHPKLAWYTLCNCSHESKKTFRHEYIHLKKAKDKKTEFLANLFPNMKRSDLETLSSITSQEEIKKYCESLGWDKKAVSSIKF